MRHILLSFVLIFFGLACNETAGNGTSAVAINAATSTTQTSSSVTAIDTSNTSKGLEAYTKSGFSDFVYIHKTENKILLTYDFFPAGYDLCQQATYDETTNPNGCKLDHTISLPCTFSTLSDDDLLSVNINANTGNSDESNCANPIVIDLSAAEITVDGIAFDLSNGFVDVFADDFEFLIDDAGFYDAADETKLQFSNTEVNLEAVYEKVISKRTT